MESNENQEKILAQREYNINIEKSEYVLRAEIDENYIYLILYEINDFLHNYKHKMDLSNIVSTLELEPSTYSDLESILKLFDDLFKNNKIEINKIDDKAYNILIELNLNENEKKYEIQLMKEKMNDNDKFNSLINKMKSMENKINELIKKDNIIQEMNEKLLRNENEIKNMKELIKENKIKELDIINENKTNIISNENIINEKDNNNKTIEEENNNNDFIEKNFNEEKELAIKDINLKMKEIETKIYNKLNDIIVDINKKLENRIDDNKINEVKLNENYKFKELKEKIDKSLYSEYLNKINYKFKKPPQNLKYIMDITNMNTPFGWNDIFEVFISYKDNKEYLVSPLCKIHNLDVFRLLDNKKILSLKGHKNDIRTIRYYLNKNDYGINEYLISADDDKIVIIWDITRKYNIKYRIDTKYDGSIYSCLLVFPHNLNDNYIITSTFYNSDNIEKSATKIYSLSNGKYINYINNTNKNSIFFLISWYNKRDKKYYIIQLSYLKIIINDLKTRELYTELKQENLELEYYSGFVYHKNHSDYLCTSSSIGHINLWDLYNKNICKKFSIKNCKLVYIIEWNKKFIIVADYNNKCFKIINLEENKACDISGKHTGNVKCIKKYIILFMVNHY